jgi:hypothetical protein
MSLTLLALIAQAAAAPAAPDRIVWTFDQLGRIGGVKAEAEGSPRMVDSPLGKAVAFDGVDDALFIPWHPLAGTKTFTFEAVFRPDGGKFEQRWFHLASDEPPGAPAPQNTRILFEVRVVEGDKWYLDAFVRGPGYNQPLMFPEKLFPTGCWYHVAQTYDGRTYRSYVNGALQGEKEIAFQPQGAGRASVGVRINRVDWFKGAVREARFTFRALQPAQFQIDPRLRNQPSRCLSA